MYLHLIAGVALGRLQGRDMRLCICAGAGRTCAGAGGSTTIAGSSCGAPTPESGDQRRRRKPEWVTSEAWQRSGWNV